MRSRSPPPARRSSRAGRSRWRPTCRARRAPPVASPGIATLTDRMQRAIVVGGSIAGLCAARVLADWFDAVTLLDRDAYPAGTLERAGVPQSRHVHALLARGRQELDRLFPGFDRRMRAAGAHEV